MNSPNADVNKKSKLPLIRDQKQRSVWCDWCSSKTIQNKIMWLSDF